MKLDADYWSLRYQENRTGWDAHEITTPLKTYIDQLEDKSIKILIPGCGPAHEAAYLYNLGFEQVYVCEWAPEPLEEFKKRHPNFPKNQLIQGDFFKLKDNNFDLIIEQTFFCALDPELRPAYAVKMIELLKTGGKLVGVLFNHPLTDEKLPYGGNKKEYLTYFEPNFSSVSITPCYNSIEPRSGNEYFIKCIK